MRVVPISAAALAVGISLGGCGGGDNPPNSPGTVVNAIAIPNVTAGTNFSFDLGLVVNRPGTPGFYVFTDRNNKSVDRIDIASQSLTAQIKGTGATAFTGVGANNGVSGPDGVNDIAPGKLYAGDVSSVKIIDTGSNTVTGVINGGMLAGSGVRADEGCVGSGPAAGTYAISSPEAATPFMTIINTATDTVIATITFTDLAGAPSAGLEQCRYDAANDLWFVNNDGTTANPHGELISMPGASIRALALGATINYTVLPGVQMYPMTATPNPGCDPTGLALGPSSDIAIMCREGTTGAPLLVQILNRVTGAIVASLNAGGGDQLEYDPASNSYYGADNRWTASGMAGPNGACSTAAPCTPVLAIIDAGSRSVVKRVPTANNAHSVAVDSASGLAFMPFSSATSPAGCDPATCGVFPNGGVLVITTR